MSSRWGAWEKSEGHGTWNWRQPQDGAASTLVELLFSSEWELNNEARLHVTELLRQLVELEFDSAPTRSLLSSAVLRSFSKLGRTSTDRLIQGIIGVPPENEGDSTEDAKISENLCAIFIHCLNSDVVADKDGFDAGSLLQDGLIDRLYTSGDSGVPCGDHAISLLFLLGCRNKTLEKIGSALCAAATSSPEPDEGSAARSLQSLGSFLSFAKDLSVRLEGSTSDNRQIVFGHLLC